MSEISDCLKRFVRREIAQAEIEDGNTPYIENGNWFIDGVDTGVVAQGVDGQDGVDGVDANLPSGFYLKNIYQFNGQIIPQTITATGNFHNIISIPTSAETVNRVREIRYKIGGQIKNQTSSPRILVSEWTGGTVEARWQTHTDTPNNNTFSIIGQSDHAIEAGLSPSIGVSVRVLDCQYYIPSTLNSYFDVKVWEWWEFE